MPASPLLPLAVALAAANGANDLSKGIATLVGSGAASPRRAALWGTAWTAAGAVAAAGVSTGLLKTFSGSGILSADALGPEMLAAVGAGASLWVLLASWRGWPVSTTHALVGALCGAGWASAGPHAVLWEAMARKVLVSLAAGPFVAAALLWLAWPLASRAAGFLRGRCLCVTEPSLALASGFAPVALLDAYSAARRRDCAGRVWLAPDLAESAHWLAAGLTCFARGMNDAPKVLALAAGGGGLGAPAFALGALAMGAGGLWAGRRVTETLGRRVTPMEPEQGLAANAVTAFLVAFASRWGLPVSTTHVASGAVIGLGLRRGSGALNRDTVKTMLAAWVVTLPAAALFAACALRLAAPR
ncbi:MAG: inorganic phosphate transporter [Elusimicrobia bacterium]|nr:inorganic phosphate transporter [Elusimicrobiota bacterium]